MLNLASNILNRLLGRKSMSLCLRDASDEDLQTVRLLLSAEARNEHFFGLASPDQVEGYLAELRSAMIDLKAGKTVGVFLQMLVVGNEIAGFVILRACPDPSELELHILVLAPSHRRKGHAKTVVKLFVDELHQSNRRLLVRCLPASKEMMSLLDAMGFSRKPTSDIVVRHFLSPALASRVDA